MVAVDNFHRVALIILEIILEILTPCSDVIDCLLHMKKVTILIAKPVDVHEVLIHISTTLWSSSYAASGA